MRLGRFLLLLGAAGALLNCASESSAEHEDSAAGAQSVSAGIPNTIGLRLTYDLPSSTLHGTVKQGLQPGEILRFNVRRGRLSAQDPNDLDCTKLPITPPMDATQTDATVLQAGFGAFDSPSTVYQGPEIDPSLLATIYPPAWIFAHVSAQGLQQLETQGADSIAEACIMKNGVVTGKVQTTVANAWDNNDPLLAGHPLTQPAIVTATATPAPASE
jgi:hypothetical protein